MEAGASISHQSANGNTALKEQPEQTASHGYFGDLTMNEWLYFHTKHVEHHLQQFGILPRDEKIPELEKLLYKLKTRIQSDTPALWGKMNSQQMVEHLSLVFALSTGKFDFPYQGTEEEAKRNWEGFLASENPWREVFSSDSFGEPKPPRKATLEDSLALLQKSFNGYLDYCEGHPDAIHPQFYLGNLTIDQWRQVHVEKEEKTCETPYATIWIGSIKAPGVPYIIPHSPT